MSKSKINKKDEVSVPKSVMRSMADALSKWADFSDEFEDFALSGDESFLQKIKKARKEHKDGNVRDLDELKKEF